ncbi:MAG: bifunctional metallophosphatase/5'-nucleotidase [Trichlorobacter sp.]|uniref:bifunctional metallophosphatase/5'-nucleotidase n=1 Tax=Trichlorobacter sp. TaxID=2911007 RepID=UPI00256BC461|nr:bifunctional metallophosphatase/5'-nucleotidase [Trichlorobacter sp.]MDK9717023.1 bifunctional metallophosphatase/5'-nucleotidase [Trichlorobacter sp.]
MLQPCCPGRSLRLLLLVLSLLLAACSNQSSRYQFTLVHMNDTHSHLEPVAVNLAMQGETVTAQLGGFARLKTVVDQMRAEDRELLLLHGGDVVQGTLYFTLFNGLPEFDFLNLLGLDAMTFGNHEFDRGPEAIPAWIKRSRFPWLSANIDFSAEPALAGLVKPYLIKEVHGEKIAIIGVTTETTPQTTMQVGKVVFNDAAESVRKQVAVLEGMGVNKIIVLSHLGYQQDRELAAKVAGIDIVVGGHSHTLMGDESLLLKIGLLPETVYPTELKGADGKRVLVLQAWQWGHFLGRLQAAFSPDGEIEQYSHAAVIPTGTSFVRNDQVVQPGTAAYQTITATLERTGIARIVAEDPQSVAMLAPYGQKVAAYRTVAIATAAEDLVRGLNSGPGPLAADSMLAAVPRAQVAILNYGGIRRDLLRGKISAGDLLEVMPFNNSLVLVDLTGAELKQALEDTVAFLITKFGKDLLTMPYVAGLHFSLHMSADKGARITKLQICTGNGRCNAVEPTAVYRTVVNSFVAKGGDGFGVIKATAGFKSDTGMIDSDAMRDYLQKLGTVRNSTEQRISVLPAN